MVTIHECSFYTHIFILSARRRSHPTSHILWTGRCMCGARVSEWGDIRLCVCLCRVYGSCEGIHKSQFIIIARMQLTKTRRCTANSSSSSVVVLLWVDTVLIPINQNYYTTFCVISVTTWSLHINFPTTKKHIHPSYYIRRSTCIYHTAPYPTKFWARNQSSPIKLTV